MKPNPKLEVLIFQAVKELGEGTREEIIDYLKASLNVEELSKTDLLRYLHKFKARKVFTIRTRNGQEVWAISEVPPWYASAMMDVLKKTTNEEMKLEIQSLNERLKEGMAYVEKASLWGNYKTFELTFETLDVLLGGHPTDEDRETSFPRRQGKLIIPPNWFNGWIRDNQALIDMVALQWHVACGSGEFIKEPETFRQVLKVKTGLNDYEAIKPGAKFKVTLRFPFRGSKIKTDEDLRKFFELLGEAPIRGLGANPKAFGGRVRLVEMKEIK